MKQLNLILISLVIYTTAFAQHEIGMKVNGGVSYLTTRVNTTNFSQQFFYRPSGQIGLFYNLRFADRIIVGADLLITQIEGKERNVAPATDPFGNPAGNITSDILRHITYFSIPVYVGYNYKRLGMNIGLRNSFLLSGSAKINSRADDGKGGYFYYEEKWGILPVKAYDPAASASLSLALSRKLAIETIYHYGLLNIYKHSNGMFTHKYQQMTLGIKYRFASIKRRN